MSAFRVQCMGLALVEVPCTGGVAGEDPEQAAHRDAGANRAAGEVVPGAEIRPERNHRGNVPADGMAAEVETVGVAAEAGRVRPHVREGAQAVEDRLRMKMVRREPVAGGIRTPREGR